MKATVIKWQEPNRGNTPPLHIASRGSRYSTLTGVCWIDDHQFLVNHRSGLRVALFDLRQGKTPIATASIPHLTDQIAAKKINEKTYEVAVSGCWDADYSLFNLTIGDKAEFNLVVTKMNESKSFCHGISYDPSGNLCLTFSTGEDPRIEIGSKIYRLPKPWGARFIDFDSETNTYYVVAVSHNPQLISYDEVATTLWSYNYESDDFNVIGKINNVHSDACKIYKGKVWFSDQRGDRVLAIDINKKLPPIKIEGNGFDFPHGLDISSEGVLAVVNYGSSSITLIDIKELVT
jgi:hypothetical protein